MKALILIAAAGLLSSGALAQSTTMNNMSDMSTGNSTGMKTTTMHHTMSSTHSSKMMHHMARHQTCSKHMRHGHMVRTCSSHTMKPMHHTATMHKKMTTTTKTKM